MTKQERDERTAALRLKLGIVPRAVANPEVCTAIELIALRYALDLTQRDFAQWLGYRGGQGGGILSAWENGEARIRPRSPQVTAKLRAAIDDARDAGLLSESELARAVARKRGTHMRRRDPVKAGASGADGEGEQRAARVEFRCADCGNRVPPRHVRVDREVVDGRTFETAWHKVKTGPGEWSKCMPVIASDRTLPRPAENGTSAVNAVSAARAASGAPS